MFSCLGLNFDSKKYRLVDRMNKILLEYHLGETLEAFRCLPVVLHTQSCFPLFRSMHAPLHSPSPCYIWMQKQCEWLKHFDRFNDIFHQLCTLNPSHWSIREGGTYLQLPADFPEITSLENVSYSVVAEDKRSLVSLASLIEQSPLFGRITIDIK